MPKRQVRGEKQLHHVSPLVERQHRLIEELRARAPRLSAADILAVELGVSVRTIERDLGRLRSAGVPITVKRGPGGGYSIDARRSLPAIGFTPGEAAAIIAAMVAFGPYTSASAGTALRKLTRALRSDTQVGADHAGDTHG